MSKLKARKFWTQSEIDYLREHYPHVKTDLIAKHLGATINRLPNITNYPELPEGSKNRSIKNGINRTR